MAAAITAPSVGVGLVADDYIHESFLLEHLTSTPTRGPFWNMFDSRGRLVEQIGLGALPWWTSPDLRVAFLRPLATLSHFIDYALWPNEPALMHVHNIVIYVLLVAVAWDLYRRLLPSAAAIWLAALLYASDDAHALGTAWIASRNTLLTGLFALLTLALYVRGRAERSALAARVAPLALLLAHASSEGAIAVWGYLLAYAVFLDGGTRIERARALVPLAIVSATWLLAASLLGFGVSGSGVYVDPRSEPLRYLAVLPERLFPLLLAQFGLARELGIALPAALRLGVDGLVVAGALAGTYGFIRAQHRDPSVPFFVMGCVVSLLPICAMGSAGRLLFIGGFGAHAAIALLLTKLPWSRAHVPLRAAARGFGSLVAAACVALAVHGAIAAPLWWKSVHAKFRRAALSLPRGAALMDSVIMLVNARDYLDTQFAMVYRRIFAAPGPLIVHVLGVSADPVRVHRLDDESLTFTPESGYLASSGTLVRSPEEPFELHDMVPLYGAFVRVERLTEDGRPAQIRLQTYDLDDPKLLWVVWDDDRQIFVEFALPAVGETTIIPGAPQEG